MYNFWLVKYLKKKLIFFIFIYQVSKDYSLKKNFKTFEIVSEHKVLLVNDTQSFLILFDMSQSKLLLYIPKCTF